MKRVIVLIAAIAGFVLLTAPTAVEYYPLYVNGHLIGNAQNVRGIIAVSVQDLAKAGGGTLTLEDAGLTLNGGGLFTVSRGNVPNKKFQKADVSSGGDYKESTAIKGEVKIDRPSLLRVNKPGARIGTTVNGDGKTWISVNDLARALGTSFTGGVKPGQPIHLRSTPQGILIGL